MSFITKLNAITERADHLFQRRAVLIAACYSFCFFVLAGSFSFLKLLWFDEFITFYVVRFHSLTDLWNELKTGVELNPPGFHILTRISSGLFGHTPFGLRAPAMIGVWVMTLCVFLFVRKRTTPAFAALAVLFTLLTSAFPYAYEARPYGIVLGCCGVSLLAWQSLAEQRWRRMRLVALGLSFGVAVSCHYYAVLLLAPIVAGELVRTIERSKLDAAVWAAMGIGISPLFIYVPLIHAALKVHGQEHVWNRPELSFLWRSYGRLLGYVAVPLAVVMVGAAYKNRKHGSPDDRCRLPYPEAVAVGVLVALPVIGFAAASSVTNMISDRYVLPSVAGCGIAFGVSCCKMANRRAAVALVLGCLLLVGFIRLQVSNMRETIAARSTWSNPALNALLRSRNVPILVKPYIALEFEHYGAPEFRSRIVCPVGTNKNHRFSEDDTPERLITAGRNIFPLRYEDFQSFRRQADTFFIFGGPVGSIEDSVISGGGSVSIVYWRAKEESPLFFASRTRDARSSLVPIVRSQNP